MIYSQLLSNNRLFSDVFRQMIETHLNMHILINFLIRAAVAQKSRAGAWKMKSPCSQAEWKSDVGVLEVCESALGAFGKRPGRFRMQRRWRRHQWRGGCDIMRERLTARDKSSVFSTLLCIAGRSFSLSPALSVRDTLLKSKEWWFLHPLKLRYIKQPRGATHAITHPLRPASIFFTAHSKLKKRSVVAVAADDIQYAIQL